MVDMNNSMTVTVRANPDADDCLTAAAESYVKNHRPDLAGWDLSPEWADDTREDVLLTVPTQTKT